MRKLNLKIYMLKLGGFILLLGFSLSSYATTQESFVYDDHGKRDPLWPLVTTGGAIMSYETDFVITDLALEGVVISPGQEDLAIINGRIVKVNDQIGQFVILQIQSDKVILLKDQQKFELRLK